MVRSHYNQKARLEQFTRKEGNKSKLTYVDLQRKKIGSRNTKSAFVEEGLYSDELENELNIKIEIPGMDVFRKVYNSESSIILTRKDLEIVKKYGSIGI